MQFSDKLNNIIKLSYVEQLSTDNDEFIFIVDCNNDRDLQQSMHTRNSLKYDRQFNVFSVLSEINVLDW